MSAVHAVPVASPLGEVLPAPVVVGSHLRLTRRGRMVFTTLAALPLVAGAIVFALNGGGAVAGDAAQPGATFDYISIAAGESLWTLAEDLAPAADPRDVIAALMELNQLPSADVQAGQRLAIPAGY